MGKPKSTPNQDLVWLEAISAPDARRANEFFERALQRLAREKPGAYDVLYTVYLGAHADESLPEFWRTRGYDTDRIRRRLLDTAIGRILDYAREERRVLYWPAPEEAKGYVEEQQKKRRKARQAFFEAKHRGARTGEAIRSAMSASRASRAAVFFWTVTERKRRKAS